MKVTPQTRKHGKQVQLFDIRPHNLSVSSLPP